MERMPHQAESQRSAENSEIARSGAERLKHIEKQSEQLKSGEQVQSVEAAREAIAKVEAPTPQEHQQAERPVGVSGLTRRVL